MLKTKEQPLLIIEHDAYLFWDNSVGCQQSLENAFKKAGAQIELIDFHEIVVRGLSLSEAMKIADTYQADYLGVAEYEKSVKTDALKIAGSNAPIRLTFQL